MKYNIKADLRRRGCVCGCGLDHVAQDRDHRGFCGLDNESLVSINGGNF